jgi:hypothetical protein
MAMSQEGDLRLLHDIAVGIFGPHQATYRAGLVEVCSAVGKVNYRTIKRWESGEYPVPSGKWDLLRVTLRRQIEALEALELELIASGRCQAKKDALVEEPAPPIEAEALPDGSIRVRVDPKAWGKPRGLK